MSLSTQLFVLEVTMVTVIDTHDTLKTMMHNNIIYRNNNILFYCLT